MKPTIRINTSLRHALRTHINREFENVLRKHGDQVSYVDISVQPLDQGRFFQKARVHISVQLKGMERFEVSASSSDTCSATSIAARRVRREIRRATRRHERIGQRGLLPLAYTSAR